MKLHNFDRAVNSTLSVVKWEQLIMNCQQSVVRNQPEKSFTFRWQLGQAIRMGFTAVQLVFNPFITFFSQVEIYSQLQLSLKSDPITFGVHKQTK